MRSFFLQIWWYFSKPLCRVGFAHTEGALKSPYRKGGFAYTEKALYMHTYTRALFSLFSYRWGCFLKPQYRRGFENLQRTSQIPLKKGLHKARGLIHSNTHTHVSGFLPTDAVGCFAKTTYRGALQTPYDLVKPSYTGCDKAPTQNCSAKPLVTSRSHSTEGASQSPHTEKLCKAFRGL